MAKSVIILTLLSTVSQALIDGEEEIVKTSTLDVNTHHQNEVFEDADHDLIEDYSQDRELEAAEKAEKDAQSHHHNDMDPMLGALRGLFGGGGDFGEEESKDDGGYVEETVDAQGRHIRKEVHEGNGWKSVSISSDNPLGAGNGDIGDFIGDAIGQMLGQAMAAANAQRQEMGMRSPMNQLRGGPVIRMVPPPFLFEEDEDDVFEDPANIIRELEMARSARGQPVFFGGPRPPIINVNPTPIADDHALVPSDDPLAHIQTETGAAAGAVKGATEHQHHIHNDSTSHSPFYIFSTLLLITAIGIFLWQTFIKENTGGLSDMLRAKQSSNSNERKEIRMSHFSKQK